LQDADINGPAALCPIHCSFGALFTPASRYFTGTVQANGRTNRYATKCKNQNDQNLARLVTFLANEWATKTVTTCLS